jgi:hypothetical protein
VTGEAVLLIVIGLVLLLVGVFGAQLLPSVSRTKRPEIAMAPTARVALFVLSGVFFLLGISRLITG